MGASRKELGRRWLGLLVFGVLIVAVAWMIGPRHGPGLTHTSVLNAWFDTRWMIGLLRLLAVAASAYAIESMAVRVARGQWLSQAGPMKAEVEQVQDVLEDRDRLREELGTALVTIERLRRAIGEESGLPLPSDATMSDTDHSSDQSGAEVDADGPEDGIQGLVP